ncbi:NAD-dependent epimerase/dehydratase family protein [Rhodoglobus sp. NPDC076762]
MRNRLRALLTGGNGMLGSSIAQAWRLARPDDQLIVITRADVDLTDKEATAAIIAREKPDLVIHAAAKVGGIQDKISRPVIYLLDNLLIDTSVIAGAIDAGVQNLLYIGSAVVYPEHYRQPFREGDVLAGPLESANEGYAIAKIAATKLCEYAATQYGFSYKVAAPSNLYGPNDDYSLGHGHLVAAAIAKIQAAKNAGSDTVEVWGDGTARREFTYVVDLAEWLVDQADKLAHWPPMLNLGYGADHSIREYYEAAAAAIEYTGGFDYDTSKPAGMHQRILDSTAARALGWNPTTSIEDGMAESYRQFLASNSPRKA